MCRVVRRGNGTVSSPHMQSLCRDMLHPASLGAGYLLYTIMLRILSGVRKDVYPRLCESAGLRIPDRKD